MGIYIYGCGNTGHQCEQSAVNSISGFERRIWELLGARGEKSATDFEQVLRGATKGKYFNHKTLEIVVLQVIVRHIVTCSVLCTLEYIWFSSYS